jgi:PIN domain nuclease of toxin-antitoxin system
MKILLDTCALIWWTLDQRQLPNQVLQTLNENDLLISSISIWEVGLKIKNKKLDIGMSIQTYTDKLKELSTLHIIPINEIIWLKNLELSWEHKDPADRTVVATASLKDCWIVTSDQVISSFYNKIIW